MRTRGARPVRYISDTCTRDWRRSVLSGYRASATQQAQTISHCSELKKCRQARPLEFDGELSADRRRRFGWPLSNQF